jgi:flagellar hook-basal body complex protein FliE
MIAPVGGVSSLSLGGLAGGEGPAAPGSLAGGHGVSGATEALGGAQDAGGLEGVGGSQGAGGVQGTSGIEGVGGSEAAGGVEGAGGAQAGTGAGEGGGFGDALTQAISSLDQSQQTASGAAQSLATGTTGDPEAAVVTVEEAQLAMQLAGQIRTKATEAVQQIFQTQV